MMSPRGSIMASFEDVESFLAVHTPPDHLIRTYLKQEGVIPKVVFDVFEKLSFLTGSDIPLITIIPRIGSLLQSATTGAYHHHERAVLSSSFKFLAIMTGNLSSPSKNAYSDGMETPLRVVIALISPFGLAMMLLGREPEPEVEAVFLDIVTNKMSPSVAGLFCSATSDETAGVEELVLTLETMALLRD
ncbi:hypothetical protein Tco_0757193 [Tanacetum coccineum]